MAHVRAFEFFGGVPQLLVQDNLKAAVSRADRYEPVLNENYRKLARHYNTAVIPARPRKPKDKPKVENAVLVVKRWILMRLRHEVYHMLAALNLAISELLQELTERLFASITEEHWLPSIHRRSNRAASPCRQNICRSGTVGNDGARTGCGPGEKASAAPPVPWWPASAPPGTSGTGLPDLPGTA